MDPDWRLRCGIGLFIRPWLAAASLFAALNHLLSPGRRSSAGPRSLRCAFLRFYISNFEDHAHLQTDYYKHKDKHKPKPLCRSLMKLEARLRTPTSSVSRSKGLVCSILARYFRAKLIICIDAPLLHNTLTRLAGVPR